MHEEVKVVLPKLGESILNATIVRWFKKVGDPVHLDEPLLEVATDKVNSEIPSPVAGVLKEILAEPDQEIEVGAPLAVIVIGEEALAARATTSSEPLPVAQEMLKEEVFHTEEKRGFLSPAVLRLAQEKGLALEELATIPATGEGGRVTKQDIENYLQKRISSSRPVKSVCPKTLSPDIERVKMTGMRKAIADNMVRSFYEAPHATLINEVDVTGVLRLIQKEKESFLAKYGVKLTITSFIAKALVRALQEFPLLNSSLDQDTIVLKRFINLGIAVSVEQGVMVPVIKHCQSLSLSSIAHAIHDLSQKARAGKLAPDEISEGTISMTNFGMSGVLIGVPIIRYPEVAIVGIGAIHKKVVVLEEDNLAVRSMVHLSLTFDHRVLDGMYGCGFLGAVRKYLEEAPKID